MSTNMRSHIMIGMDIVMAGGTTTRQGHQLVVLISMIGMIEDIMMTKRLDRTACMAKVSVETPMRAAHQELMVITQKIDSDMATSPQGDRCLPTPEIGKNAVKGREVQNTITKEEVEALLVTEKAQINSTGKEVCHPIPVRFHQNDQGKIWKTVKEVEDSHWTTGHLEEIEEVGLLCHQQDAQVQNQLATGITFSKSWRKIKQTMNSLNQLCLPLPLLMLKMKVAIAQTDGSSHHRRRTVTQ